MQGQDSQGIQVTFFIPTFNMTSRQACQNVNLSVCFATNSSCMFQTGTPSTLSGKKVSVNVKSLQSATHYRVRVRFACQGPAVWSGTVDFNASAGTCMQVSV